MGTDVIKGKIQDQAYSYGTMGNFFSAMEWYANKSALEKKDSSQL